MGVLAARLRAVTTAATNAIKAGTDAFGSSEGAFAGACVLSLPVVTCSEPSLDVGSTDFLLGTVKIRSATTPVGGWTSCRQESIG
jgi:hypothetical protein